MSTSGRHQDIPTDITTPTDPSTEADQPIDALADTSGGTPGGETTDDSARPVQLVLETPDAHVRFHLDRRTRELGLAHVAEIKRQLAANAARRAEQQAAASRTPVRRSASDRAA